MAGRIPTHEVPRPSTGLGGVEAATHRLPGDGREAASPPSTGAGREAASPLYTGPGREAAGPAYTRPGSRGSKPTVYWAGARGGRPSVYEAGVAGQRSHRLRARSARQQAPHCPAGAGGEAEPQATAFEGGGSLGYWVHLLVSWQRLPPKLLAGPQHMPDHRQQFATTRHERGPFRTSPGESRIEGVELSIGSNQSERSHPQCPAK